MSRRRILFLTFSLCLLAAGCNSQKISEQKPQNQVIPTAKPSQTQMQFADSSSWKTYSNKEYGFEIKYPVKWNITVADKKVFGDDIKIDTGILESHDGITIQKDNGKSLDEIIGSISDKSVIKNITDILIDNEKAKQIEMQEFGTSYLIYVKHSGYLYTFNLMASKNSNFLSTFKFIK